MLLSGQQKEFRPPAAPLIAHDPYFSIWSMADRLADDATRHWTRTVQALTSLARVDGKTYRIMRREPQQIPVLPQTRLQVLPTRTIYDFEGSGIRITLTFLTPALPQDLDILSRPASYITGEVQSADGRVHAVEVYFDASSDLVVNSPDQPAVWSRSELGGLKVLRIGSQEQPILEKHGDDLRIDWGYLYIAALGPDVSEAVTDSPRAKALFQECGCLPNSDDLMDDLIAHRQRRRVPVLAYRLDFGKVGAQPVAKYLALAYDDVFSIEYLNRRLQPYWRRNGADAADLLRAAVSNYESLSAKCKAFDRELMAYLGIGKLSLQSGRAKEAIPFLQRAVQLLPNRPKAHYLLAQALIQTGQAERGKEELAKVEKISSAKQRRDAQVLSRIMDPAQK